MASYAPNRNRIEEISSVLMGLASGMGKPWAPLQNDLNLFQIELKLLAPQGALERLREMPVIVQHARNRGAFRRLETVYYDTPERLLFQHGMSLRVRRSGKHFVQTLKLLPNSGQPLTRRQWEAPVDGFSPDLARLPADEVGDPGRR
jgi:inorganic triphosphatase YgiF